MSRCVSELMIQDLVALDDCRLRNIDATRYTGDAAGTIAGDHLVSVPCEYLSATDMCGFP